MAGIERLWAWEEALKEALAREKARVFAGLPSAVARRAADLGQEIWAYHTMPRAMDFLRQRITQADISNATVVVSRRLTGARGRFSRTWWAEEGGLWCALAFYDDWLPEVRGWFPILFGLGVAAGLRQLGAPVAVKWVNDVHLAGQKVCGVLIEQVQLQDEAWALVGLGLNVNNPAPQGIPALSLKEILGQELDLSRVFGLVMAHIAKFYALLRCYEEALLETRYEEDQPVNPLYQAFLDLSDTPGQKVLFAYNLEEEKEAGVVKGIASDGALLLETSQGELRLNSGEILYLD